MKIFLALLLTSISIAQTNWYISTTSSGDASGDSWANKRAAEDVTSSWQTSNLGAGDTVFIDGGADSLVYTFLNSNNAGATPATFAIVKGGTSGNYIVWTRGKDANHNGVPVFRGLITGKQAININADYVELSYVKVDSGWGDAGNQRGVLTLQSSAKGIDILHNEIVFSNDCGIYAGLPNDIRIMNNYIHAEGNTSTIEDAIVLAGATGTNYSNIEIAYNIINNTSTYTSSGMAHSDLIQAPNLQLSGGTSSIHHNFFSNVRGTPIAFSAGIYLNGVRGIWNIYNNIIVNDQTNNLSGVYRAATGTATLTANVYNNTFYSSAGGNIVFDDIDTLRFKNNIVKKPNQEGLVFSGTTENNYLDIDFNQYDVDSSKIVDDDNDRGWYYWQNVYNADANGELAVMVLENAGSIIPEDYALAFGSSGIDEGFDLSAYFTTDYRDTTRTGTWDVGAWEYLDSLSSNIEVRGKVFLQGPFETNSMITNLSQNGLLPNIQPFNTEPWNYNGNESLSSGSTSTYVDWVLVELRNSSNPTQVLARQAAILKNDGTLLSYDGSIGILFKNIQEDSYYIAVFHRNHLPIMSANPVLLSANSQFYDFTSAMNKAYGTDPMASLGDGKFGMYASDGNGNGGITISDRNEIWVLQNGNMGYLNGDFNLDGGVTASDVNLYWNLNNGTMTQVP
jgi:hypothetical protein